MQPIHSKCYQISYLKSILSAMLFLALGGHAVGQLQVVPSNQEPYDDPTTLITNELVGDGIIINNVSFPSDPASLGYFNTGSTKIGIESGLVLSTGVVSNIPVTNINGSSFGTPHANPLEFDPDMRILADTLVTDVSLFELEFIPLGDTIRMRFVFASEEYPSFSCSGFNDAFGLFLSGPGVSGGQGYTNDAKNIALLTDGMTQISTATVRPSYTDPVTGEFCPGLNENIYNENPANASLLFNGFLDVVEVVQKVTPCETYNLKIAIADAGVFGDPNNPTANPDIDSGVFLEGGSFSSNAPTTELSANSQNGIIQEDCDPAEIANQVHPYSLIHWKITP